MVTEDGVDAEELGRATWTFLHTLAATHPAKPTTDEVQRVKRFMEDFTHIYPCAPCAESFREIVKKRPVDALTGPRFARWMCDAHNDVNRELGKALFDCNQVADRWGVCESCARHADKLHDFQAALANAGPFAQANRKAR